MASGGTSLSGTPSLRPSSPLPSPSPLSSITNSTSPELNAADGAEEKKPNPTTICVFCGSKPGKSPAHSMSFPWISWFGSMKGTRGEWNGG